MNLIDIKKQFDHRHDFDDSDFIILKKRHSSVNILNIPTAWIIPIDDLLCRFKNDQVIKEVRQEFGQLIVIFKDRLQDQTQLLNYKKIVEQFNCVIKNIDKDLEYGLES